MTGGVVVKIQLDIDEKPRDGATYWMVKNWNYSATVEKDVHYKFRNLFNGNKQLCEYYSYIIDRYISSIKIMRREKTFC